ASRTAVMPAGCARGRPSPCPPITPKRARTICVPVSRPSRSRLAISIVWTPDRQPVHDALHARNARDHLGHAVFFVLGQDLTRQTHLSRMHGDLQFAAAPHITVVEQRLDVPMDPLVDALEIAR